MTPLSRRSPAVADRLRRPLVVALVAIGAIVVLELATASAPDHGAVADLRFIAEGALALVVVAAALAGAVQRLRRPR